MNAMASDAQPFADGFSSVAAFDPRRLVLIVGAPRSGTTWLSRMLGEHPAIAALPNELTLFSNYLSPIASAYQGELKRQRPGRPPFGLPALISQAELDAVLRAAVAEVYARVKATKPGASIILDKHPGYTHHLPVIESLATGCRYIHLVRDGRDAIASMLRVRDLLGKSAASVQGCSGEWATCVLRAQELAERVGQGRCMTIRYEDMLADTPGRLFEALRFCGIEADANDVARISQRHHHSLGLAAQGVPIGKEPGSSAWRGLFSLSQRYWIERIAGTQLKRLGYAADGWWAFGLMDRLRMSGYSTRVKLDDSVKALRGIWTKPMTRSIGAAHP